MDKEDALICFEEHIRLLEKDHEEEKEREKRRLRRLYRKNREAFVVFLDELHEKGKLTSLSMWKDLYELLSRDERFYKMLSQPGSTPLDLFKFYVLELKSRFSREKRIVKDILAARGFTVEFTTALDAFLAVVELEERGRALDPGNVRMAYTSFIEKAESVERQRRKDAARTQKRAETAFKVMLTGHEVRASASWEDVCQKLGALDEFKAVELESDRMKFFKEYLLTTRSVSRGRVSPPLGCGPDHSKQQQQQQQHHLQQQQQQQRKRKHRSNSRDSNSSGRIVDQQHKKPPKRKKMKKHSRDSSMESREKNGTEDESRGKYKLHKKSKKKKKKRKQQQHSSSDEMGAMLAAATGHRTSAAAAVAHADTRQPSEGEVIDEDDEAMLPRPPSRHKHAAVSSSAEMSENELEAEKNKLLAELQN